MMEKILSISVAAYNLENMIRQCLDSFVEDEILKKVEVLVTDDGSKDNTREIVKEYEDKYPGSFKLIAQKNAGPGSTVNSGLLHATGKYFRMVDGDDWVDTEEMTEYLKYLEEHDTDMVCTNYTCVDNVTGEKRKNRMQVTTWEREMIFQDVAGSIQLEMHNVTFRTEILKKNKIILDNGFYTDTEYLLLPVPYIKTIAFLDKNIYMYRVSLDTQSINIKSLQKNVQMHRIVLNRLLEEYEKYRQSDDWNESIGKYYCARIAYITGTQLSIYLSFTNPNKYKKMTQELVKSIKDEHVDVYRNIMKLKTFKLLVWSNFLTFNVISKMHRKRLGLK